ncbi:CzcE family metal-binding protein [Massilia sp. LXY-6]|uniref:CzcE family metal-binding protein n=1 Tax=Massilia sp. LXY-6 TaxID=3379823 RepID=UPI003EE3A03F
MKAKLLISAVATAIFTFSSTAVFAYAATQPASFRGSAAPAGAAVDQVIIVTDATRHVNVVGGSTVRFVVGDRSFSWSFQNGSAHVLPFDLGAVAPQGLLSHPVTAYVSDNPLYQST